MREKTKTRLKRLVVGVVVGLQLNTVAFYAWADAAITGAQLGQQTVQSSIQAFDPSAATLTLQELFPDLAPGSVDSLESVYGDDSETIQTGVNANQRLRSEISMDGEAYRTLVDSSKRISPDLSKDPMFNTADQVRNADFMSGFKQNFADCKSKDVFEEVNKQAHVAKYRTCERVADQGGDIKFKHDYKAGVVEYVSGQPNYQSCGVGCLYIWVGTVGDNYWEGNCRVYEEYTRFRVINKGAIKSAVIEQATFDDYFQIYFNNNLIWTHTPGVFPPETNGSCERGTSWQVNPNENVTAQFQTADDVITFKTRTSVTGGGEGYARIKIEYDPSKAFQDNGWSPEDKLPTFDMIQDGFCPSSTVRCETMGNVDSNGCLTENGVIVCPDQVPASPHSALSPFCKVADVSADCAFYKGDLECYTDANGEQQCLTNGSESCGVNHELSLFSQGLTGRIAANGRDVVTAEFDFVAGTWSTLSPSDGTRFNGSVTKVNYEDFCGANVSQVDHIGTGVWPEHGLGGKLDTTIDHKITMQPTCENGLKARVQIRDQKSESDLEWTLSGEFRFRLARLERDVWTPQSCVAQGQAVLNGECQNGSITVMKGVQGEGECATISGVNICPGSPLYNQIKPSPLGTSRLSEQVRVTGCGTTKDTLNTCKAMEENPSCGFISQSCVKGASGEKGGCYAYSEIWDCGYDVTYPTVINTGQTIDCPGGARCMGSECFDNSNVKSGDFAYAVAMLQVAQFAEHDLDCGGDGTDIETANDCKVFKGEAMECKKALGGYVDCCEAPESVSIFDYVNLTMNTLKMASSIEALQRGQYAAGSGYWAASKSAITSGASELIKGEWGSIVDSATGAFQDTFATGVESGLVSEIQKWLMQKAYDAMVEMGASSAANAVFATNANGAVTGLSNAAGAVVNIIGWVYMVYVIVDLLINIIWECEEKEFELGAKKETRQCHFVGSYCASKALGSCVEKRETYCCFGSVVGRIIQESARDQLGLGWGEVETPSCDGITPAQMSQMDWNQVDLSEWIGMLSMADRLPTMNTVSMDHLTGEGSRLGISESDTRLNTLDRNLERFKDFDPDEVKKKAEQELR